MLSKTEIIQILKKELPNLRERYNVKRIGIFGSVAQNTFNEESDIDLFLEFEKPIGFKFIRLFDYLENLLDSKVDILTPEGIRSIRVKSVSDDIQRGIIYV